MCAMNGPESKPWVQPMRRPSLRRAPVRLAARSAANRQARREVRGRGFFSSSKVGSRPPEARTRTGQASPPASADRGSPGMRVQRRLDELAQPVELVRLGGQAVRIGAAERPQRRANTSHVAMDDTQGGGVLEPGRSSVDAQELVEVVERPERVSQQLLERVDLLDPRVDRLALGRAYVSVRVDP